MEPTAAPPDPTTLLRELTAAQVRARLDAVEAERKGLLVLLRSLMARDRAARRREVLRAP